MVRFQSSACSCQSLHVGIPPQCLLLLHSLPLFSNVSYLSPPPLFFPLSPHLSYISVFGVICWILLKCIPHQWQKLKKISPESLDFSVLSLIFFGKVSTGFGLQLCDSCPVETCPLSADPFNFSHCLISDIVTSVSWGDVETIGYCNTVKQYNRWYNGGAHLLKPCDNLNKVDAAYSLD